MTKRLLRSVNFNPDDSITIEFVTPDEDFKANGLALNHAIYIPSGEDYDDEIDAVRETVLELLADALDDVPRLGPYRAPGQGGDDDDD